MIISPGAAPIFSVAGFRFRVGSEPGSRRRVRLPASYRRFRTRERHHFDIRLLARDELQPSPGALLFDSKQQWRAVRERASTGFELVHPATSRLYCRAMFRCDPPGADVLFTDPVRQDLSGSPSSAGDWEIPYPLEQLLLVPEMARHGTLMLHASGAIVQGRALVFAGHSGDGKTTLARLLHSEGIELLSDERVAIRRTADGFFAFGTPWPGEGNVVSSAGYPLAGLFVLRKAQTHWIGRRSPSLGAEILARTIVPYYLPETVARILDLFSDLAAEVPLRELHFAREPGLASLLRSAG